MKGGRSRVEFVSKVRGQQLGVELRAYMEAANLDSKQCGRILGWSESRVSRILTGKWTSIRDGFEGTSVSISDPVAQGPTGGASGARSPAALAP